MDEITKTVWLSVCGSPSGDWKLLEKRIVDCWVVGTPFRAVGRSGSLMTQQSMIQFYTDFQSPLGKPQTDNKVVRELDARQSGVTLEKLIM